MFFETRIIRDYIYISSCSYVVVYIVPILDTQVECITLNKMFIPILLKVSWFNVTV